MPTERRCPHCGHPVPADASFCLACGSSLLSPTPLPATPRRRSPWWLWGGIALALIGVVVLLLWMLPRQTVDRPPDADAAGTTAATTTAEASMTSAVETADMTTDTESGTGSSTTRHSATETAAGKATTAAASARPTAPMTTKTAAATKAPTTTTAKPATPTTKAPTTTTIQAATVTTTTTVKSFILVEPDVVLPHRQGKLRIYAHSHTETSNGDGTYTVQITASVVNASDTVAYTGGVSAQLRHREFIGGKEVLTVLSPSDGTVRTLAPNESGTFAIYFYNVPGQNYYYRFD